MSGAGWYYDQNSAGMLRWWDGQRWTGHVREAARPDPPPDTPDPSDGTPAPKKGGTIALILLFVLLWPVPGLLLCGGGLYVLHVKQTGTPTEATVTECHREGRRGTVCTGTWTVGELTEGGRVVVGRIEDATQDDVGTTLEVRASGNRAYTTSLRLPVVLIGIGLCCLLVPPVLLWINRRSQSDGPNWSG